MTTTRTPHAISTKQLLWYRYFFACIAYVVLSCFVLLPSGMVYAASFTIAPGRQDTSKNLNSDWFVYSAQAGDVIEDTLKIQNQTSDNSNVSVSSHDIKPTNQGSFSVTSEGEDNSEVGSWTSFRQGEYAINPNSFIEIPFTITIPQGISAGEYAGGITAYSAEDSAGGLNVRVRQGVRIYIMIGEEYKVGATLDDFSIVNIADQDYLKSLPPAESIGKGDLVVRFLPQYSGTVFASLSAVVSVTFEDGRSVEVPYKSELIPRTSAKPQFVRLNTPYTAGRMSARIVYTITPLNNPAKSQTSGVSEAELTLTQEQLDQAGIAANPTINTPLSPSSQSEVPRVTFVEFVVGWSLIMLVFLASLGGYFWIGVLIVILLIASGYIYLKKRKKNDEVANQKSQD